MVNHLCIGTAQFGFDYGITNINGKVKEENVKKILEKANNSNIHFIDTAQAYSDSEYVLGRNIPKTRPPSKGFKGIILKIARSILRIIKLYNMSYTHSPTAV